MQLDSISDNIYKLGDCVRSKNPTSTLHNTLEALGRCYLQSGINYQPASITFKRPSIADLQLDVAKRHLDILVATVDMSPQEIKECRRFFRILKVAQICAPLHLAEPAKQTVIELVKQLEETIFTPRFIHAAQADPARRQLLKATKGLIPVLQAIQEPSLQRKIVFLTALIQLICVPESLFCNPAYHGPAVLFLSYNLFPNYFQSKQSLREGLAYFFAEYIEHYATTKESYIIMPGLPLEEESMCVCYEQQKIPLSHIENSWRLQAGPQFLDNSSLTQLLLKSFPQLSPCRPTYTFEAESISSHPAKYIYELHDAAYAAIERECLPESMKYSLVGAEVRLNLRAAYDTWRLQTPQDGVNYLIHRATRPFFRVVCRTANGKMKTRLLAYDLQSGLYQWEKITPYIPARSPHEMLEQLYPDRKLTAIYPLPHKKFLEERAGSFFIPSHEKTRRLPDEYYTIVQASQNSDKVDQAVERLLYGLFSRRCIIRSLEQPSLRELLHATRDLGIALDKLLQGGSVANKLLPVYTFLSDLVFAVTLPTDLFIDIGNHGPQFLFWVYENYPSIFTQKSDERNRTFHDIIAKEYAPNFFLKTSRGGYIVVPEFARPFSNVVRIYLPREPSRQACYRERWFFLPEAGAAPTYHDFAQLIRSAGIEQPTASARFSVHVPMPIESAAYLEEYHASLCSNLETYSSMFLKPCESEASYCMINAHSQHSYYLLVKDCKKFTKKLLLHDPVRGLYRLISKNQALNGTFAEVLARLYPGKELRKVAAPEQKQPQANRGSVITA